MSARRQMLRWDGPSVSERRADERARHARREPESAPARAARLRAIARGQNFDTTTTAGTPARGGS